MRSLRILVIDDDIDFADLVRMRLESWGHQPVVVHNWLAGMMHVSREPCDCMIVDVETPTGNGLTACRDLNDDPKIESIPKVFVTGLNDPETIQHCRQMGAGYIHKSTHLFPELKTYLERQEPAFASVDASQMNGQS